MSARRVLIAALAVLVVSCLVGVSLSLRQSVNAFPDLAMKPRLEGQSDAIEPTAIPVPIFETDWERSDPATGGVVYDTIKETERGENFSYLESSRGGIDELVARFEASPPPNVWDVVSQSIVRESSGAILELACLRGFDYWIVAAEREQPGFYVFLTNDEATPIGELLGRMYSERVQRSFDRSGYMRARRQSRILGPRSCFGNDSSSLARKYAQDCPRFAESEPAHCKALRPLDSGR